MICPKVFLCFYFAESDLAWYFYVRVQSSVCVIYVRDMFSPAYELSMFVTCSVQRMRCLCS